MIDDCAFCNYPKLKDLRLWNNPGLSYIHENAFGYAYNGTFPALETFSLEFCNLSIIPENLLNWNNITKFGLGNNPFTCNCSMAWLINDLISPSHTMNLQNIAPQFYRYHWESEWIDFKCSKPFRFKNIPFIKISHNFCPNEAKNQFERNVLTNSSKSSHFVIPWSQIFAGVIFTFFGFIFGISIIPFIRFFRYSKNFNVGFVNQNFPDELTEEDFDGEKIVCNA